MRYPTIRRRGQLLALWALCATLSFGTDAATKSMHHAVVVNHYAHTPPAILATLAVFLLLLGVGKSPLVAVGSGFMFGGLCGNGGQVLLFGYASDWIPIGDWLTNVADIAGATGLLCCFAGYLGLPLHRTKAPSGGSGMGSHAR